MGLLRRGWLRVGLPAVAAMVLLASGVAQAAEYHGVVTFGGQPLPGATVTATRDGKTLTTVTNEQGAYAFADLPDGTWTIEVQMSLFAPVKQDVPVAAGVAAGTFELKLLTLAQIQAQAKPVELAASAAPAAVGGSGVSAVASANTAKPTAPAKGAPAKGNASAAAQAGGPPPAPEPVQPMDTQQQKAADGFLINGSVNNAATSAFSQNQRFGNGVNNGRRLYTGMVSLLFNNSALNANQYSLTGQATPKPEYSQFTGSALLGGPIRIPHVMRNGPTFTLQYAWMRNTTATTADALVPDDNERAGRLAELPIQVYDPKTGSPIANNDLTACPQGSTTCTPLSQQAQALLNLYPHANVTGNPVYNYQAPVVSSVHQDQLQFRANRNLGPRDNFYGTYAMQNTRSSQPQSIFGYADKSNSLGMDANVNWGHRFGQTFLLRNLYMTLTYDYSRSRNQTQIGFEDVTNVSGNAGITGNNQDPTNWGPPSLGFASSGIAGLSDGQSAYNRNQTNRGSVSLQWNHGRHYFQGGGDYRRQEFNYLQQLNARGGFGFTGAATQGAGGVGGSDLADFLLGVPDTSQLATGNADKYLRQSVYDAFFTDDWRMRPELTVNIGLRWEYGAPITELKNRLVNLDVAQGFTAVAPVLASSPTGPLTGQVYPNALMRPDKRDGIEPRLALSWLPIPGSSLVVRANYGIYEDTSVYQGIALQMAQQPPLSRTLSVQNSVACPSTTLVNAFANCSASTPNTFAVDPNFRVGYAQLWLVSVQRDLPFALQMTATYQGTKGTRGVQKFLPNTYAYTANNGANPCSSCPVGFYYLMSNGDSTRESGTVQLRRRLRNGFTSGVQYTYSKALDDDAALGGQGPLAGGSTSQSTGAQNTAQNWQNLRGERGLSSFDQRHQLTANVQYTTGMGLHGGTLLGGWRGAVYRDWTFLTNITAGTGTPETPVYAVTLPGTSYTNIMRPNATGISPNTAVNGSFLNGAAYAAPADGTFGSARRNSITGPGQFSMDASMARTFRLKERYSLDAQLNATNVLNHVTFTQWNTTLAPVKTTQGTALTGNTQFGHPLSPNGMRAVQGTLRLRF